MSEVNDIKEFAAKYHLSYPVGQENGIAEALGVTGIPEFVFVDKEGRIVKRHSGNLSYNELVRRIKGLLKQE
ncbi:hypothetical protein MNBD_DELTA03-814 [hydrothermal vent metagenome]|uniref:Thioredoxin domain-containing protein n=1 Tax=hydrothermal vent metagenome TaxID=652676 RepID=A0A3B0VLS0_9ZZZZ